MTEENNNYFNNEKLLELCIQNNKQIIGRISEDWYDYFDTPRNDYSEIIKVSVNNNNIRSVVLENGNIVKNPNNNNILSKININELELEAYLNILTDYVKKLELNVGFFDFNLKTKIKELKILINEKHTELINETGTSSRYYFKNGKRLTREEYRKRYSINQELFTPTRIKDYSSSTKHYFNNSNKENTSSVFYFDKRNIENKSSEDSNQNEDSSESSGESSYTSSFNSSIEKNKEKKEESSSSELEEEEENKKVELVVLEKSHHINDNKNGENEEKQEVEKKSRDNEEKKEIELENKKNRIIKKNKKVRIKININGWNQNAIITIMNWREQFKEYKYIYEWLLDRNLKISGRLALISIFSSGLLGLLSAIKLWLGDDKSFQIASDLVMLFSNFIIAALTSISKNYIDDNLNEKIKLYIDEVDIFLGKINSEMTKSPEFRENAQIFIRNNQESYAKLCTHRPQISAKNLINGRHEYSVYKEEISKHQILNMV